ncbi:MAG: helix-turn-helix transcriptional regulator, partial [Planctomycetes bacterium]|nr:helix-turn-helix transcriptional regulator [Planctomycetota bacterium]
MDETSSQVGRTVERVTVLAQRLNQLCLQKGWDKKQLAKAAGVSRTT